MRIGSICQKLTFARVWLVRAYAPQSSFAKSRLYASAQCVEGGRYVVLFEVLPRLFRRALEQMHCVAQRAARLNIAAQRLSPPSG